MRYTVRCCHLERLPELSIGEIINYGDIVGTMGNTGKSDGIHLHIDCVEGYIATPWRLRQMEIGEVVPAFTQLVYFIDNGLFKDNYVVTSHIYDPEYLHKYNMNHPAIDIISKSLLIYWNRSMSGTVLSIGYDGGYGNYIHIGFNA